MNLLVNFWGKTNANQGCSLHFEHNILPEASGSTLK